ncbi:MAG: hypothetical protein ACXIUZ_03985 [Lysobacteraceae bacterium]
MMQSSTVFRRLTVAALAVSLVATSGCGLFRSKSAYEQSRETRPLEVPPDLNRPAIDPAMQLPTVAEQASRPAGASAPGGGVSRFDIDDSAESAWRRVGLALERIEGVTITNRAQLLSSFEVSYGGESFLVQVRPAGDRNATVTAVTASGQSIGSGPAAELLGLLRQRLG